MADDEYYKSMAVEPDFENLTVHHPIFRDDNITMRKKLIDGQFIISKGYNPITQLRIVHPVIIDNPKINVIGYFNNIIEPNDGRNYKPLSVQTPKSQTKKK